MREISAHELLKTRHCDIVDCPEIDDVDQTGRCSTHRADPRTFTEKLGIAIVVDPSRPPGTIEIRQRRPRALRTLTSELSTRELEVLGRAAAGDTSAEIAAAIFLSTNTVISHRKRLLEKLGAKTIAHAVAIAMRKGILT